MDKRIDKILQTGFEPPLPRKKEEFLHELRMPKVTFWESLIYQVAYIRKRVWCLSVVIGMFTTVLLILEHTTDYINTEISVLWIISACIPFFSLLTATELAKSSLCGMEELELSTRYSLPQIMIARILILGVGNMILLSVICGMLCLNGSDKLLRVGLLIFTPYFLTCGSALFLMNHMRGKESVLACGVIAFFVSLSIIILRVSISTLLAHHYYGRWMGVCVLSMLFLGMQIRIFIKSRESMVCWEPMEQGKPHSCVCCVGF